MQVTIGMQEPDKVDLAVLTVGLPRGRAEVTAVFGGLNVHGADQQTAHVIATAAVEAFLPIEATTLAALTEPPQPVRPSDHAAMVGIRWRLVLQRQTQDADSVRSVAETT